MRGARLGQWLRQWYALAHMFNAYGIQFTPPDGFAADELMVTLKAPPVSDLKDPRMLQKQFPVRPNLIIHRRITGPTATLELLGAEICAELVSSIPAMTGLGTDPFVFADKAPGIMVTFDFPVGKATVRQFQAMRLDDGVLTTLTLTVDSTTLSDKLRAGYFSSLGSMKPPPKSTVAGYLNP